MSIKFRKVDAVEVVADDAKVRLPPCDEIVVVGRCPPLGRRAGADGARVPVRFLER